MKTITALGAIALLLPAIALTQAGTARAQARLGHQPSARDGTSEDFYQCIEDTGATDDDIAQYIGMQPPPMDKQGVKCVSGCYFQWKNVIVGLEFNEGNFKKLYRPYLGKDELRKAADECQADMAGVSNEICELGAAIQACETRAFEESNLL